MAQIRAAVNPQETVHCRNSDCAGAADFRQRQPDETTVNQTLNLLLKRKADQDVFTKQVGARRLVMASQDEKRYRLEVNLVRFVHLLRLMGLARYQ